MMVETIKIPARRHVPLWLKLFPVWWFLNDEKKPGDSFYYLYIRNPLQNFRTYVVGIADHDHWVTGQKPADANLWLDLGQTGWKWALLRWGIIVLPYVSYSGVKFAFYLGWQPMGRLGLRMTW